MSPRIPQLALLVAGLVIALYPLTFAFGDITCRGTAMRPGDSCVKADGKSAQTYAQRDADRRAAAPVITVVGLLVAGLGTTMLVGSRQPRPVS